MCKGCVMDTSDPHISFDAHGTCNHCYLFRAAEAAHPQAFQLDEAAIDACVSDIKRRGRGREYDCIVGLSGGIDSSYLAYKAKQYGLRPLAVHMDNGWNSAVSIRNIRRIVQHLNLDLVTYVHDWETFSDLQIAFLRASVSDAEIPTDHAIAAVTFRTALKFNIPTILSGTNIVTEDILPYAWTYGVRDSRYIRSVHAQYGKKSLAAYPSYSRTDLLRYWYVNGMRTVKLLNCEPYNKHDAMELLRRECGWEQYGGKHEESIYTRFFQGYILPHKFSIDKRRAHFSSLILSCQMTRDEALTMLSNPPYPLHQMEQDRQYVLRRFNLSEEEFEQIMALPPRQYTEFNTYRTPRGVQKFTDTLQVWCGMGFHPHIHL